MNSQITHTADIASQIHPHTNLREFEQQGAMVMAGGEGVWVYDDAGNKYLEGMSGLWCVSLGYGNRRLIDAATRQLSELAYYQNFAHKSTRPAIELAEKLLKIAPVPMSKVMFQSSGSEANDTAIKLCWYYWNAHGQPQRRKMISRLNAYHGTGIASASLTGLPHLHKEWNLPLPGFLHTDNPHYYRHGAAGESPEDFASRCAKNLEELILREGPDTIAAFFAEPIMGTGGLIVPPPSYFEKIQAVLRKYSILLVVDEVITGFGRTGQMWGTQVFDLRPDIITCAKALSSAYMPIAALLLNERIYEAMRDQTDKLGVLAHGYTYGAHPVCAAVALEAVRIYEGESFLNHVRDVGGYLQSTVRERFANHPLIGEIRGVGMFCALEIVRDKLSKEGFASTLKVPAHVSSVAQTKGLMTRPLLNSVVFAPPLITERAHIDYAMDIYTAAFQETLDWLRAAGNF
ncbi:MAG: aminotransferase [Pseudomonadota bacterium]|nr:aminotransferase [Pseudomonadota bacterium]